MKGPTPLFLIVSSYLFGIVCIQYGKWPILVQFTWFQMVLTAVLLYINHASSTKNKGITSFFLVSSIVGFLIECLGVNTGVIFGEYSYGSPLGFKIFGTPPVIGLNWFIVCYLAGYITDKLMANAAILIKTAAAATLIVLLDILIEPDAIRHGMWTWEAASVPVQNYIAWFVVGLVIEYHYFKHLQHDNNKIAIPTAVMMTLFFVL